MEFHIVWTSSWQMNLLQWRKKIKRKFSTWLYQLVMRLKIHTWPGRHNQPCTILWESHFSGILANDDWRCLISLVFWDQHYDDLLNLKYKPLKKMISNVEVFIMHFICCIVLFNLMHHSMGFLDFSVVFLSDFFCYKLHIFCFPHFIRDHWHHT